MSKKMFFKGFIPLSVGLLLCALGAGCATGRSEMEGRFLGEVVTHTHPAEKVNVLFIMKHVRQAEGLDAIPKLDGEQEIIDDFDDLFLDALKELENLNSYAAFTEFASDLSNPERRERRDRLMAESDYVVRIRFMRRYSFISHFFGTFVSTLSATLLPMPYTHFFSVEAAVFNASDAKIAAYSRTADLTTWVQTFLIFLQPFHQEKIKKEQIYIEFLHDIFRQMEAEGILVK